MAETQTLESTRHTNHVETCKFWLRTLVKNFNTSAVQSWDIAKSKKLQETPLKAQLGTQNDFGHVPAPIESYARSMKLKRSGFSGTNR